MNEDRRICACKAEKSIDESPFTWSMVIVKVNFDGEGDLVPGRGEPALVEGADPFCERMGVDCGGEATLRSTRHEPIASLVYRQKIGRMEEVDSFRERGERDTKAFPMKE